MGGEAAIPRHNRPIILQNVRFFAFFRQRDHRLNGDGHAGSEYESLPGLSEVRHLWILVDIASDAVSDPVPDDSEARRFRNFLNGVPNIAKMYARTARGDAGLETLLRCLDELQRFGIRHAKCDRPRRIAIEAVLEDADVGLYEIARHDDAILKAYCTKLVTHLMRDLGSIPAPQNSFLLNLGLETLHLRMIRHCENALKVAQWLEKNPLVNWINYAGLPSNKYHQLAQKYMPNGTCGVIAFGLKGTREDAIRFMDNLEFISIVTHVADARTCVLHPASHTHRQLSDQQLQEAGIAPDLIRLSVGIEDVEDIIADLQQAMDKM